jgi:hypothetical protein
LYSSDLALVKLETSDAQDLTHVSGLPSALLIDALRFTGERPSEDGMG